MLPVNLSGGALSANPIFAAGLIRIAEAASLITGQSPGQSVKAETAVAHATSGLAMQSNIVYVLGSS
jgi:acetyl-CoA acetyltransferase